MGETFGACYNDWLEPNYAPEVANVTLPRVVLRLPIGASYAEITIDGEYLYGGTGSGLGCGPTQLKRYLGRRVTVDTGLGNADVDEAYGTYRAWRECPDWTPYEGDIDGEWSIKIDAELCFETTGSGWPDYGGAAVPEPPEESNVRYFWRARAGGSLIVACAAGGLTASATTSITTENRFEVSYDLAVEPYCLAITRNGSCKVTAKFEDSPIAPELYSRTETNTWATVSGCEFTVGVVGEEGIDSHEGTLYATVAPKREFVFTGSIGAMNGPYPGAVTIEYQRDSNTEFRTFDTDPTGLFAGTYGQKRYEIYSELDGSADAGIAADEWIPVKFWVENTWLSEHGEDTDDWRILLRGKWYDSFTVSQASSYQLDDGAAVTDAEPCPGDWTNTEYCTLTAVGGPPADRIEIVVSGGIGSCKRTFDPEVSLAGFRYLRIRVRSVGSDAEPLRVKIGSKWWDIETGADGTWVERDIDLCCPTNTTATTDGTDSRFPTPTVDGELWGVTQIDEIEFVSLPDGATYEIDDISEVRRASTALPPGRSTLTFLPAFQLWLEDSDGGSQENRRFLLGDTDGRQSLEEIDFSRAPDGMGGWTYTIRSIEDLLDGVNAIDSDVVRNPGWTATAVGSFPSDGFHNNDRPAIWAYGGGAMYGKLGAETTSRWYYGFDLNFTGSGTVKAQALWDSIEWPPAIGDLFGYADGEYGGAIVLAPGKMFRGQAHGLVFLEDQTPREHAWVVASVAATDAVVGVGLTDKLGRYITGPYHGKGQVSHDITLMASVNTLFYARKRHRASFRRDPGCQLFMASPIYFPFAPRFSDPDLVPVEEWRRIPAPEGDGRDRAPEWRPISGRAELDQKALSEADRDRLLSRTANGRGDGEGGSDALGDP